MLNETFRRERTSEAVESGGVIMDESYAPEELTKIAREQGADENFQAIGRTLRVGPFTIILGENGEGYFLPRPLEEVIYEGEEDDPAEEAAMAEVISLSQSKFARFALAGLGGLAAACGNLDLSNSNSTSDQLGISAAPLSAVDLANVNSAVELPGTQFGDLRPNISYINSQPYLVFNRANRGGEIYIRPYQAGDDICSTTVSETLVNIPYQAYYAAIYQDQNGNNKIVAATSSGTVIGDLDENFNATNLIANPTLDVGVDFTFIPPKNSGDTPKLFVLDTTSPFIYDLHTELVQPIDVSRLGVSACGMPFGYPNTPNEAAIGSKWMSGSRTCRLVFGPDLQTLLAAPQDLTSVNIAMMNNLPYANRLEAPVILGNNLIFQATIPGGQGPGTTPTKIYCAVIPHTTSPDAGVDAGQPDATTPDTGHIDSSVLDSGQNDAGQTYPDAQPTDNGIHPDGGVHPDAQPTDTGEHADAEPADSGVHPDAAAPDAETRDAIPGDTLPTDRGVTLDATINPDATTHPDATTNPDASTSPDAGANCVTTLPNQFELSSGNCHLTVCPTATGHRATIDGQVSTTETCEAQVYINGHTEPLTLRVDNQEDGQISIACDYNGTSLECEPGVFTSALVLEDGHGGTIRVYGTTTGSSASKFKVVKLPNNRLSVESLNTPEEGMVFVSSDLFKLPVEPGKKYIVDLEALKYINEAGEENGLPPRIPPIPKHEDPSGCGCETTSQNPADATTELLFLAAMSLVARRKSPKSILQTIGQALRKIAFKRTV